MVLAAQPAARGVWEPKDALDAAMEHIDTGSPAELLDCAWILASLAANDQFLTDEINVDLESALSGDPTKTYSPQSMMLGSNEKVALRANFWLPAPTSAANKVIENDAYSYELPHDHNFSFSTIGYAGPGYETELYEYDRMAVQGFIGERVDLLRCPDQKLERGRVLVFESCRDVHVQRPPAELSVSINMIARNEAELLRPQFIFGLNPATIVGLAEGPLLKRLHLLKFAAKFGNDETGQLVEQLLPKVEEPLERAACYYAVEHLAEDPAERMFDLGREDELVRVHLASLRQGAI